MTNEEYERVKKEIVDAVLLRIELLPSFNQKSAYDMGARDMKNAIVREVKALAP
jgi:hypothetical protein